LDEIILEANKLGFGDLKIAPILRCLTWVCSLLTLSACGQLDSIPYSPEQTAQTWLQIQPFWKFQFGGREIILVQPSTSALVYLLGILAIGIGLYFWRNRVNQRSRLWWGIALLLWGIGALLAGTSYEAFSYVIKCAGREACQWTSWWEIGYLIASVWSIDAMLIAEAWSCASGKGRTILMAYAIINACSYLVVVLIGTLLPVKLMVSFELLLAVSAPGILSLFGLNLWRYLRYKNGMDLALLGAWLWLGITIGAYFLYFISNLTQKLWLKGIWFSENDVLHIGLILWMVYLAIIIRPRLFDEHQNI
jgi:hypothetical protein